MSTESKSSIVHNPSRLEESTNSKQWHKIVTNMIRNSFEVGKNLPDVLSSVLESILVLIQARAGMFMLLSDDKLRLVEIASKGFTTSKFQPLTIPRNIDLEGFLRKRLIPGIECEERDFLIVWLGTKDSEIGALAIYCAGWLVHDQNTNKLLELLKAQISSGIERMLAYNKIKRRDLIAKASLMQLGKALGSKLDIKKLAHQITHAAMAIVEADLCDVLLLKQGSLEFLVASSFNKILKGYGDVPLKNDPAARIVERGKPVIIRNIHPKSRFHNRLWLKDEQYKSYIGVPIKQEDKVIGILEVFSKSSAKFSDADQKILQSLAGPIAAALRNIRSIEETKKKAEELKILHSHTSQIVAKTDIEKVMKEIVDAARSAVGCLMAAAALYNSKTNCFEYRTTYIDPILGERGLTKAQATSATYTEDVYAEILRTGRALRLDDIRLHKKDNSKQSEGVLLRGFLGVPLVDEHKNTCGVVMASFKKDGSLFTEADEEVLSTLANQASIAIQSIRLYQQLEQKAKGLKNLLAVSQQVNSSNDSSRVQKAVVDAVSNLFDVKSVCIALYNEAEDSLRISRSLINGVEALANEKLLIDKSMKSQLFNGKQPIFIPPADLSNLRLGEKSLVDYFDSFLGIPLVVKNRVIGVLGVSINSEADKGWLADELELLHIFANQIAIAIDNSRLYEETLRKAHNLATTLEISKIITSETDLAQIFERISLFIRKLFSVKYGCIFLSDRSGENLNLVYRWGRDPTSFKIEQIPIDVFNIHGRVFLEKEQIVINDLGSDNSIKITCLEFDKDIRSAVITPLVVKGEACGVMTLLSKESHFFNDERLSIINIFTNQFAIAIRNNQLYARVIEEEVARREAEISVELLQEKSKNAVVIERTADGIFMVDEDFNIQVFNPALEEMTGMKAYKVIGRKCQDVFREVFIEGNVCEKCPMWANNGQQSDRIKAHIKLKNGETRFIEISHSVINQGKRKGFIGTIRDITKEHALEVYQHDLRIATDVQRNILPRTKPKIEGLDIGFLCKPAKQIGGDYFDFIPLENEKLGIAIGDVAGKSLPAALLVSMHKYVLRSAAANTDSVISPMRALNQIIWEDTSPEVFVTTIYGVYNPKTSVFAYANAGHMPPLLYSNGSTKYLWAPQMPLGIQQNLSIDQHEVRLKNGDILVLLSDGVTDIRNSQGNYFGLVRLRRIIRKYAHLSAQELAEEIFSHTMNFSAGELSDDFTIVVIKCTKTSEDIGVKELVISNKPIAVNDARKFIANALKEKNVDEEILSDILVAACEAVTNCVLHGQSPDGLDNNIRIRCSFEGTDFKLMVTDNGIGYHPNLSEWRPPDLVRDRGRGIYLMKKLMDKVEFLAGNRGATIVLTKNILRKRGM